ncbi:MAG TPA: V4R domain-containing protein [Myxococcota bacterium]|nr:V4R domain-containing protein [Myxococcota bacterium]
MTDERDEEAGLIEAAVAAPEAVDAFDDPDELERLRANAFESVGLPLAEGILYGIGMAEGLFDALRVAQRFAGPLGGSPGHAGPGLDLLFQPAGLARDGCFAGSLHRSVESAVHQRRYGRAASPICHVTAGYCAGWYSELLGRFVLVREGACGGADAARCDFEAKPAELWTSEGDPWAAALLRVLDWEAMRESARKRLAAAGDAREGDMLGAFDPLSPAVHVWGPVMVLPYSGAGDTLAALETIAADLGPEAIRVVVLDVTGARVDGVEATGLVRILDELARRNLESVLVGVGDAEAARWLGGPQRLAQPLRAHDISEAIHLAFQLATFS